MEYVHILGRILFGGYFMFNGINHFMYRKMLTGYAVSKKVPLASAAIPVTGLMLLAGGFSFLINFHALAGSLILILFLIPVTIQMHNFWTIKDERQKMAEMVNFTKNLALIGALIMFAELRYVSQIAL
jgi:putative oxidoreductase